MPASLTLLQIIQTACAEMGLQQQTAVVGSTSLQVQQLFALANREVRELQQNYEWTALQTEYDLHVGQPIATTGNLTQNGYQITNIPSTTGISAQLFVVNGSSIPVDTRVVSVDSSTQITMDQPATANVMGTSLTFAQDTYPEPPDFDRFINQTWWDRTNRWSLLGPDSPQIDQWHRSGIVTIGPRRHFRQIGSLGTSTSVLGTLKNYRLWPPPGATDTPLDLVFEYITAWPVWSSTGVGQTAFQADTDITLLDANMIIMGIKWRFFQIKGWDYGSLQQEYQDYVSRKYSNDGGNKTLNMSTSRYGVFITPANVQDGSFPGPIGTN